MLSILEAELLTKLINHVDGVAKLPVPALADTLGALRRAVAEALSSRVAMQRGALDRQAQRRALGLASHPGRPSTALYEVALGTLWATKVLGANAALELVRRTLTEHSGGRPPTKNSLMVQLSTKGQWWRHVETDAGAHDLTVRRAGSLEQIAAPPAQAAPTAETAKPKRRRKPIA